MSNLWGALHIDGRDCCQTGQPSQDVTDGALTNYSQFGEINQSDIDLILFYRGEYEKYFDSLKDGDECLSFKDFIECLRSENGSGFKEGKVISKY
ncbi:hypothetical protein [Escherichia coli]|uniref:hypothetical protein n=1 Tax=Escherichia coli TaxID=562 RepID=UPI00094272F9|nr:hypothetical protein [Escherichia coli]OKU67743.1 hypothetical protein AWP45_22700 [Escherichia coli]OKW54612.1 hypothetical protein AWP76_11410 [Escherichia coli]